MFSWAAEAAALGQMGTECCAQVYISSNLKGKGEAGPPGPLQRQLEFKAANNLNANANYYKI